MQKIKFCSRYRHTSFDRRNDRFTTWSRDIRRLTCKSPYPCEVPLLYGTHGTADIWVRLERILCKRESRNLMSVRRGRFRSPLAQNGMKWTVGSAESISPLMESVILIIKEDTFGYRIISFRDKENILVHWSVETRVSRDLTYISNREWNSLFSVCHSLRTRSYKNHYWRNWST